MIGKYKHANVLVATFNWQKTLAVCDAKLFTLNGKIYVKNSAHALRDTLCDWRYSFSALHAHAFSYNKQHMHEHIFPFTALLLFQFDVWNKQ